MYAQKARDAKRAEEDGIAPPTVAPSEVALDEVAPVGVAPIVDQQQARHDQLNDETEHQEQEEHHPSSATRFCGRRGHIVPLSSFSLKKESKTKFNKWCDPCLVRLIIANRYTFQPTDVPLGQGKGHRTQSQSKEEGCEEGHDCGRRIAGSVQSGGNVLRRTALVT